MLDKSIPYKNIIMAIPAAAVAATVPSPLPPGYARRLFQDGDERHWARIETSVLEFETEAKAQEYFSTFYTPLDEVKRRCLFITDPSGNPVATATAWFFADRDARQAQIQWVGVQPDQQGRGLGRAIVTGALALHPTLEPGGDVILHTQTWSHPAVALYRSLGFQMVKDKAAVMLGRSPDGKTVTPLPNDYAEAIAVLRTVLKPEQVDELEASAL